jgi:hypothetical protein
LLHLVHQDKKHHLKRKKTPQNQRKTDEKNKKNFPQNIKQMENMDLQQAIATIITNPNKRWKNLRREKYMVRSYFQTD